MAMQVLQGVLVVLEMQEVLVLPVQLVCPVLLGLLDQEVIQDLLEMLEELDRPDSQDLLDHPVPEGI